jgi:hypothetical protein
MGGKTRGINFIITTKLQLIMQLIGLLVIT